MGIPLQLQPQLQEVDILLQLHFKENRGKLGRIGENQRKSDKISKIVKNRRKSGKIRGDRKNHKTLKNLGKLGGIRESRGKFKK